MFAPYCTTHGSRILLGYESVVDIEQTPFGPKVLLRCHCGALLAHDSAAPAIADRPLADRLAAGAHASAGPACVTCR